MVPFLAGTRRVSLLQTSRPAVGPDQSLTQSVPDTRFAKAKQPENGTGQFHPSVPRVKDKWSYTSTVPSHIRLHDFPTDNFIFQLISHLFLECP